ncbi:hypothetical protein RSPO_m01586 (plasmid) [Ralstonia solanacearum Po82]|uniref:Uncharacterized protein n=1 Tax=Ralstonia solanacearum (strain Po82) TaxID=1031711 RepID=F6GBT1_RALS8|nr:hypothetical protein RSPO_m01586 [Ralstonia solanacearum Po82]
MRSSDPVPDSVRSRRRGSVRSGSGNLTDVARRSDGSVASVAPADGLSPENTAARDLPFGTSRDSAGDGVPAEPSPCDAPVQPKLIRPNFNIPTSLPGAPDIGPDHQAGCLSAGGSGPDSRVVSRAMFSAMRPGKFSGKARHDAQHDDASTRRMRTARSDARIA